MRGPIVEAAIAVGLIAGLYLAFRPTAVPAPLTPAQLWAGRAAPVISSLLSDTGAGPPGAGSAVTAPADPSHLRRDLAAARRLPLPPTVALRHEWQKALAELQQAPGPGEARNAAETLAAISTLAGRSE